MKLDKGNRSESEGWLVEAWRSRWVDVARYVIIAGMIAAIAQQLDPRFDIRTLADRWVGDGFRYLVAQFSADPLRITIDVKHKHFLKLAEKRETAIDVGMLVSSTGDFVPARIRKGDTVLRAKMRLKGDLSDHWSDPEKWSFRIAMKGGDTLFGMKQFSIQHPSTRDYAAEWLLHRLLRYEGLPALRYDFVEVVLNGKNLGIYALEEHFEKRLIENSRRREGPIIRFNEDLCWAEIADGQVGAEDTSCTGSGGGSYLAADVDAFHTGELLADPKQSDLYVAAVRLLEGFRSNELSTSEVFDTKLLARYFALLELLDAHHAAYWRNARFYYNPVTSRLEPIAFDSGSEGQPSTHALVSTLRAIYDTRDPQNYYYHLSWIDSLFRDKDFYALYVAELERVSQPGYFEGFMGVVGDELDRSLEILHREFPSVAFDSEEVRNRQRFIRSWINPPKTLHAHLLSQKGGEVTLQLGNLQYLPVELLGLRRGEVVYPPTLGDPVIEGRSAAKSVQYRKFVFSLPPQVREEDEGGGGTEGIEEKTALTVESRILGSKSIHSTSIFPWAQGSGSRLRDLTRIPPNIETFDFAVVDRKSQVVRLRPGSWTIDRDLIVPANLTLRAGPGTRLELRNGAMILSFSPVEFTGTEDSPVVIQSILSPDESAGTGLIVLGAGSMSLLENVRFANLSAPERSGWQITGGVTFYESPLTATKCIFDGTRAEDALNVIRSSFSIDGSLFQNSFSDALDVDFSEGTVSNSSFVESGNDAVDVSGSDVRLERVLVNRAGDKGLSAGEDSRLHGSELRIRDTYVAVASKDLSQVKIREVMIEGAKVGFAAYQKKSEFGPGRITVLGIEAKSIGRIHLIEEGSVLQLEDKRVLANAQGVAGQLYPEP